MENRRYETLVLINPELGEPGAEGIVKRITEILESQGSVISQVQNWGLRDLAYPISKQSRAVYALFEYRASSAALAESERHLKLMEPVLRFVSIRQAENAPPAAQRPLRAPDRGDETTGEGEEQGEELS